MRNEGRMGREGKKGEKDRKEARSGMKERERWEGKREPEGRRERSEHCTELFRKLLAVAAEGRTGGAVFKWQ